MNREEVHYSNDELSLNWSQKHAELYGSIKSEEDETKYEEHLEHNRGKEYKPSYIRRTIPIMIMIVLFIFQNTLKSKSNIICFICFIFGNIAEWSSIEVWSNFYWMIMFLYTAILVTMFIVVYCYTRREDEYHGEIGYFVDYKWSCWQMLTVIIFR